MKNVETLPEIEEIVLLLTAEYCIERIYINTYGRLKFPYELVILISENDIGKLNDLVPKIENTLLNYQKYKALCFLTHHAMHKIVNGSLFLFTSCQAKKLIYKKKKSKLVLIPDNFDFEQCKKLMISFKDREQIKINEFIETYYHLIEKTNYSLAAFMLHQAFEFTYRYLEIVILAKERITHSIRYHHRHLKRISEFYTGVFTENSKNDMALLKVLENMYRGTRYEDFFSIDTSTLQQLEDKMKILVDIAEKVFEETIHFFQKIDTDNNLQNDQIPDVLTMMPIRNIDSNLQLKDAVDYVVSNISQPLTIYLFGYRHRSFFISGINTGDTGEDVDSYFDFLVITEIDLRESLSNVQVLFNKRQKASLLILSFTYDEIQKQLDKNTPFFHKILQNKERIVHNGLKVHNWKFHRNDGFRTMKGIEKARKVWQQNSNNANGYFHGGYAIDDSEEVVIKVLLHNKAIEHVGRGLIELVYGFKPYENSLSHIYNLCCSFWYFPNDIFPRTTEEDKLVFREFVHLVENVHDKGQSYIDWGEAYRYEKRCERFINQCNMIANEMF